MGELEVTHLIAGGMGVRARDLFAQKGIEVIIGVEGPIDKIVAGFLSGEIQPGVYGGLCSGGEGHGCGC